MDSVAITNQRPIGAVKTKTLQSQANNEKAFTLRALAAISVIIMAAWVLTA